MFVFFLLIKIFEFEIVSNVFPDLEIINVNFFLLSLCNGIFEKLSTNVNFLFFGFILAYLSNLVRMALIILTGHYYGHESLIFVHKYLGWLIFTSWCLLFWFIYEKFNRNLLRYKI